MGAGPQEGGATELELATEEGALDTEAAELTTETELDTLATELDTAVTELETTGAALELCAGAELIAVEDSLELLVSPVPTQPQSAKVTLLMNNIFMAVFIVPPPLK